MPDDATLPADPRSGPPAQAPSATRISASAAPADSTRASAATSPWQPPGEFPEVPGYEVRGEIARGGMGRVLAAFDPAFGREVAVKLVLAGRAADAASRFVREARVTGQLTHPSIPPAYQLGRLVDGSPFLAMKLVRGQTLAALLADRPSPGHDLPRFVGVFEQVCQAVGYAHSRGVIHRDIKPQNVMVGAFGEVQVMDWGLARAQGDDDRGTADDPDPDGGPDDRTRAGAVLGTPAYMAPEQARGETVDARADVFALGGVLSAVLADRPPFQTTDVASTIGQAASGDTSGVLAALAGCGADAELVAVARRCLAPSPADRPADGTAVAALVAAYRAGVEERLRAAERDRAAAEARAAERRKRLRVQLALAAAVALLLAGGGAGAWWKDAHERHRMELTLRAERLEAERQADEFRHAAEAERAAADRRVALARRDQEVAAFLGDAEAAVRASDASRAALLLGQIGEPDAARMAEPAAARLRRCRSDLLLLPELDRVEQVRWQVQGSKYRKADAAAAVAAVLARLGIDPGRTPPAEAAAAVGASLVTRRLVVELTWWAFSSRDYPETQAALRDVLDRLDPDAFRSAARAAVVGRRWDDLAALVRRADEAGQPAWFVAALASINTVEHGLRAAAVEAAIRRTPDDFTALMILGQLDLPSRSGTAARRARACQAAVALRPGTAAAWYNLGTALRDGGNAAAALAAFDEAVRLAPDYAAAHTGRGTALAVLGDRAREEAAYRAGVAADKNYPPAHNNLGALFFARAGTGGPTRDRDLAEAEAAFSRAVELDAKYSTALAGLGDVWRARGDRTRAAAEYEKAITVAADDPAGYFGLAFTREEEKDVPGAVAALRRGLAACPSSAPMRYYLARALSAEGRLAEGRDFLRAAVRLDPKYADAHLVLGRQLEDRGELEGALEHYEAALAAATGNADASAGRDRVRARLAAPRE